MNSVSTMALPSPLQNLSDHARWLYPLSVIVAAAILGHFFGLGLGLLIVGGGTLVGSIWLLWSSLQGLGSDAPITLEEAISLGAPTVEEEQKRSVLRALKDLEYERAVGKISDEDYASLSEHYRTEAKRLLRAVDRDLSPERERAERILAERLATTQSPAAQSPAAQSPAAQSPAAKSSGAKNDAAAAGEAASSETAAADGTADPGQPAAVVAEDAEGEPARASKSRSSDAAT
jgi:hypothetical protein